MTYTSLTVADPTASALGGSTTPETGADATYRSAACAAVATPGVSFANAIFPTMGCSISPSELTSAPTNQRVAAAVGAGMAPALSNVDTRLPFK